VCEGYGEVNEKYQYHTPLTTIKGTLQLLQQHGLDVDTSFLQKSLDAALRAVHRLEQFGKEILK
jgi:signal transduction histidine kinase